MTHYSGEYEKELEVKTYSEEEITNNLEAGRKWHDNGLTPTESNPIEPSHYTELKISPLEYIMENEGEFTWCIANVIKYVSRYKKKNGLEDLKKAQWYLARQIKQLEDK